MFISKHNFVWTSKQFRARVYLHSRDWAEWIVKITGWLGICRQKLRLSSSFKSETRLCRALKLMRRGKSLTFASSLRHLRTICFLFSRFCYSKEKSRIRSRFACFCAKDSIKFPLKPKKLTALETFCDGKALFTFNLCFWQDVGYDMNWGRQVLVEDWNLIIF